MIPTNRTTIASFTFVSILISCQRWNTIFRLELQSHHHDDHFEAPPQSYFATGNDTQTISSSFNQNVTTTSSTINSFPTTNPSLNSVATTLSLPNFLNQFVAEDGFSACLLVMDDNHYLIEWLSYHWLTLPLRRLIIAIDPRSRTRPTEILDRYRSRGLMNITEWHDIDFLPPSSTAKDDDNVHALAELHRRRQVYFIQACTKQLHAEGRTWTAVIDTDEYILPNPHAKGFLKLKRIHPTVLETLQSPENQGMSSIPSTGCIRVPRLRIGVKESTDGAVNDMVPHGFNGSHFQTLRWRWHGAIRGKQAHRNGKSMVDLSHVKDTAVFQGNAFNKASPHAALRSLCEGNDPTFDYLPAAPFVVHHYCGTLEQWQFRRDARNWVRQQSEYASFAKLEDGHDDTIRPWIGQMVDVLGKNTSIILLAGAGQIESTISENLIP